MKTRPTNQTLALSVTAIVLVLVMRLVEWLHICLFIQQEGPKAEWDTDVGFASLLLLVIALVLGLLYCIRASIAAFRARPLPRHTLLAFGVAWLLTGICGSLVAVAFTPASLDTWFFILW